MKNLKDIILILLCALCFWLLIKPKETVQLPPIHEIETRIEYHDTIIKQIETRVIEKNVNNAILEHKIDLLSVSLDSAKQRRDTVLIIQIQDTTIHTLKQSNDTLKSIINLQVDIIEHKDSIINGKDQIIEVMGVDLKKKKRQRNVLGLVGVALVGLLLMK
jgi:membrane-bound ClpP family serine protease